MAEPNSQTRDRAGASRETFGALPDGRTVEAVILAAETGLQARILTYGASIHALLAPDRSGELADVALGHSTLAEYLDHPQYMGATVGRVANRIAGGRFTLDGVDYRVPVNNGTNSLHGGTEGFDKANWEIVELSAEPCTRLVLRHVSGDGDQGYPGTVAATATYSIGPDALTVQYRATCDRPTVVNLSNHAYWNLAGEGAEEGAMDHRLMIPADSYLPTAEGSIPTGEFRPVAGTPFDFRTPERIGARVRDGSDAQLRIGRGYDHAWAIAREAAPEPRLLARLEHGGSGRIMEILSDQPGLQFYSGNFLDGTTVGKKGEMYRMGDAVALEPQKFPDTPNRPEFGSVRLEPGETYRNTIVWHFSTAD